MSSNSNCSICNGPHGMTTCTHPRRAAIIQEKMVFFWGRITQEIASVMQLFSRNYGANFDIDTSKMDYLCDRIVHEVMMKLNNKPLRVICYRFGMGVSGCKTELCIRIARQDETVIHILGDINRNMEGTQRLTESYRNMNKIRESLIYSLSRIVFQNPREIATTPLPELQFEPVNVATATRVNVVTPERPARQTDTTPPPMGLTRDFIRRLMTPRTDAEAVPPTRLDFEQENGGRPFAEVWSFGRVPTATVRGPTTFWQGKVGVVCCPTNSDGDAKGECGICLSNAEESALAYRLGCGHAYCSCLIQLVNCDDKAYCQKCPTCRQLITRITALSEPAMQEFRERVAPNKYTYHEMKDILLGVVADAGTKDSFRP